MSTDLPEYIRPKGMHWQGITPFPSEVGTNTVLGIYYNILKPQEWDAEVRQKFYTWISSLDSSYFPIKDEDLAYCSPSACLKIANKAFYGQLAMQLSLRLKSEIFDVALENALKHLEDCVASIYKKMGELFSQKELRQTSPALKLRFKILAESFASCGQFPRQSLDYAIQKYRTVQHDPTQLAALLVGSIEKSAGQELRVQDKWEHRSIPLMRMIRDIINEHSTSAFFLALQEATPDSLEDLKKEFADKNIHWVSFNNISGKETVPVSFASEIVPGEAGSLTATIGLSPELQLQRAQLGYLPTCSGVPRTILGIEVHNRNTEESFAIFSAHTDYMVEGNLYQNNVESIEHFVRDFIGNKPLHFILGGDLNAFEGMGGDEYIKNLRAQPTFAQSSDYREGAFFCPNEIQNATFIGHERDDYKVLFTLEGYVQPNALDHIFLTRQKIYGFRIAGVYDENGVLVDPVQEPDRFRVHLQNRNTVSDHFLNAVLSMSSPR